MAPPITAPTAVPGPEDNWGESKNFRIIGGSSVSFYPDPKIPADPKIPKAAAASVVRAVSVTIVLVSRFCSMAYSLFKGVDAGASTEADLALWNIGTD
jgi:hypothetical protein